MKTIETLLSGSDMSSTRAIWMYKALDRYRVIIVDKSNYTVWYQSDNVTECLEWLTKYYLKLYKKG